MRFATRNSWTLTSLIGAAHPAGKMSADLSLVSQAGDFDKKDNADGESRSFE